MRSVLATNRRPNIRRRRLHRPQLARRAQPLLQPAAYFAWKHWFDRAVAALLLIPALPLIGLCGLVVLVTCGRPVFYRQVRMGRQGRTFTMYKIRSMRRDAEAQSGAIWSPRQDRRVTLFGKFLRATHVDELPQLLNVLMGEMNLIGPRPERPAIVRHLLRDVPDYADRMAVPPGITGLAQVQLPSDTALADVRRKLFYDIHYVQSASLGMDLRILVRTVPHLFLLNRLGWRPRQAASSDLQAAARKTQPQVPVAISFVPEPSPAASASVQQVA